MKEYQQRVLDEQHELDCKRGRLISFLTSEQTLSLDQDDLDLMNAQRSAMDRYSEILDRRIQRFK